MTLDIETYKHWDIWQDDFICECPDAKVGPMVIGPPHPVADHRVVFWPLDPLSDPFLLVDKGSNLLDPQLSPGKILLRICGVEVVNF